MRSDNYDLNRYLSGNERQIKVKLEFGTTDTITSVQSLDIDTDFGSTIAIGNTVSTSVKVTCETPSFSLRDKEFTLFFGVILSGTTVTWTKMGKFKILPGDIENRLGFSTFTAYDKMYYKTKDIYYSNLSYPGSEEDPTTMNKVLAEIGNKCGLSVPDLTVSPFVNPAVPADYLSEYTLRDALGYIASYQGMNAYIDSDGDTVVFKWFTPCSYSVNGYYANVPYADEKDVVIKKLIVSTGEDNIQAGTGSDGLIFNNPLMTSERLEAMLPDFENFTYRRLDADIPVGNYLLEPWDILHISYIENPMDPVAQQREITYTAPAMSISFHYDGGLSCKASSHGVADSVMKSISARKFTDHTKFNGLQKEIVHATNAITGADGGYVRINFGDDGKTAEILIMNSQNIDDPNLHLWRWNQGGLGYSEEGYDGPYSTAITNDGHIVADRITGNLISGVGIQTIAADMESFLRMNKGYITFFKRNQGQESSGQYVGEELGGIHATKEADGKNVMFLYCEPDDYIAFGVKGGVGRVYFEPKNEKFWIGFDLEVTRHAYIAGDAYIRGYGQYQSQRWNISEYLYNANTNIDGLKARVEALEGRMTTVEANLNGLFTKIEE